MDAGAEDASSMTVPVLVVVSTVIVSLEILQHLLIARFLAALVMMAMWTTLLPIDVQVKALCSAIIYHGAAELCHQIAQQFSCFFDKQKDRRVILWLLFWMRVFIWGATFAVMSVTTTAHAAAGFDRLPHWSWMVVIAMHSELFEVLVMLYFAGEDLPYIWRKRVLLWMLSLFVGMLETSGWLTTLTTTLLADMSPLALVGVLLMLMWLSIEVPWHRCAEFLQKTSSKPLKRKRSRTHYYGNNEMEEDMNGDLYHYQYAREYYDDDEVEEEEDDDNDEYRAEFYR